MTQAPSTQPGGILQPHRGTLILVFSILSWVLCFIFGIVAWVMANSDLQKMEAGQMDPSGEGITKAGKIVAMIHVILCIVAIPIAILMFILAAAGAAAAGAAGAGG